MWLQLQDKSVKPREAQYCSQCGGQSHPIGLVVKFKEDCQAVDELIRSLQHHFPCDLKADTGCRSRIKGTLEVVEQLMREILFELQMVDHSRQNNWILASELNLESLAKEEEHGDLDPLYYLLDRRDYFLHPHETYEELIEDIRRLATTLRALQHERTRESQPQGNK